MVGRDFIEKKNTLNRTACSETNGTGLNLNIGMLMRGNLTEETAASQRVINSKFTDGLDSHALYLIDRVVKGLELTPQNEAYLIQHLKNDERLADHFDLELDIAHRVTHPQWRTQ